MGVWLDLLPSDLYHSDPNVLLIPSWLYAEQLQMEQSIQLVHSGLSTNTS